MRITTLLTLLTPLVIVTSSVACSSHRRIEIHDRAPADSALMPQHLHILERIESGAFSEAECELADLSSRLPQEPDAVAGHRLLSHWLEHKREAFRRRDPQPAAGVQCPAPAPELQEPARAQAPEKFGQPLSPQEIEFRKREGMRLYGEGKVAAALALWQQVLAAAPADEETRKLAARAETVLSNQSSR